MQGCVRLQGFLFIFFLSLQVLPRLYFSMQRSGDGKLLTFLLNYCRGKSQSNSSAAAAEAARPLEHRLWGGGGGRRVGETEESPVQEPDDDYSRFDSLIRRDAVGGATTGAAPAHAANGPCPWRGMFLRLSPVKPEAGPWSQASAPLWGRGSPPLTRQCSRWYRQACARWV